MPQIIIVTLIFMFAFTGMGLALHFSKYKKNNSGCCGGGHCDKLPGESHSCKN
jgi:hypothetical protein